MHNVLLLLDLDFDLDFDLDLDLDDGALVLPGAVEDLDPLDLDFDLDFDLEADDDVHPVGAAVLDLDLLLLLDLLIVGLLDLLMPLPMPLPLPVAVDGAMVMGSFFFFFFFFIIWSWRPLLRRSETIGIASTGAVSPGSSPINNRRGPLTPRAPRMREGEEDAAATADPPAPAAGPTSWLQMGAAIIVMTAEARIQGSRMALAHMVAIQRGVCVWGGGYRERAPIDQKWIASSSCEG